MAVEVGTRAEGVTSVPNPLRAGLDSNRIPDPCNIVFFGASGDLMKRMLLPAMYNLRLGDILPTNFGIVGFSRSDKSHYDFRDEMKAAIDEFSRSGEARDPLWSDFANRLHYISGSFDDLDAFKALKAQLEDNDEKLGTGGNRLYYLSTPPTVFGKIVQQ
ncbi:MAG: glucose-6-phosphate dehydrogenase, partial [Candidatus Eremiobacteraeota bacterium]|nr:glucose-6-phosphate dehydrogenase [Candidatus Eremiobacteraeota bacterium]